MFSSISSQRIKAGGVCLLIFSDMNLCSQANGDPISVPTQDMPIGLCINNQESSR